MLICIIGDVNLDHLSKVVTGRILLWKFTIIPFIIVNIFQGRKSQTMHRSSFCFNFHLLFQRMALCTDLLKYFRGENLRLCTDLLSALTFTCSFSRILPMAIIIMVLQCDFFIFLTFYLFINWNFSQGIFFQFSITYSAIYMYSQNGAEPYRALPSTKVPPCPLPLIRRKADVSQASPESQKSRLKQLMIRTIGRVTESLVPP